MSRPKVSVENYKAVYDFYKEHRPGRASAWMLNHALGIAFAPRVRYARGADDAIAQIFKEGGSIVIASNHVKGVDPCVIASLSAREEPFAGLLGNAFIPSKSPIQQVPVVRHLVDGLGAIPVFREKDLKDGDDEEARRKLRSATLGLVSTCVAKLNAGESMGVFPEGERNRTDPTKVQPLQTGIGIMVCRVTEVPQPPLVPIGIRYDEGAGGIRQPVVFVGHPSVEPFNSRREVSQWLPEQMQVSLDAAHR